MSNEAGPMVPVKETRVVQSLFVVSTSSDGWLDDESEAEPI